MSENDSIAQPERTHSRWRIFRIFLIGFIVWLAIALLLWLGVKNAPVKKSDPDEKPFQIIPLSED